MHPDETASRGVRATRMLTAAVPSAALLGGVALLAVTTTPLGDAVASSTSRVPETYLELAAAAAGGERLGTDCVRGSGRVLFTVRNPGDRPRSVRWTVDVRGLGAGTSAPTGAPSAERSGEVVVPPGATAPVTTSLATPQQGTWGVTVALPADDLALVLRCGDDR